MNLTFSFADDSQGNRLDAAGTQAALDLAPQQWRDLVTDQSIEDPAGLTVVTFNKGHGTQVEYFSKNRCYLWYPGNHRALRCEWKKTPGRRMCFRYEGRTYNPSTGKHSNNAWQCRPYDGWVFYIKRACAGDVFQLATGRVPYIMKKSRAQLWKILKTCKK